MRLRSYRHPQSLIRRSASTTTTGFSRLSFRFSDSPRLFMSSAPSLQPNDTKRSASIVSMNPTAAAAATGPVTASSGGSSAAAAKAPKPALISVADYHHYGKMHLPKATYDFFRSGACDEFTLTENETAFQRVRIRPRVLVDVAKVDISTKVLGAAISSPIAIAPWSIQCLAHPDGELAMARAAKQMSTAMILSSAATFSLESVAAECGRAVPKWFQCYILKDRAFTLQLIKRAEAAGYTALVLTVDRPVIGKRELDLKNQFSVPQHMCTVNMPFLSSPAAQAYAAAQAAAQSATNGSAVGGGGVPVSVVAPLVAAAIASGGEGKPIEQELHKAADKYFDASLSWADIAWFKSVTPLPIILKGIFTGEDAVLAVQAGVAGIIVSNHGARQLDGVCATVEVLEEVVKATRAAEKERKSSNAGSGGGGKAVVAHKPIEIYIDGGIRRGTDVFKCLALGASAVFIGRPTVWGLHYDGEHGVVGVLSLLNKELRDTMALAGCTDLRSITRSHLMNAPTYTLNAGPQLSKL